MGEQEQTSIQKSTGYWITRLARSMEQDFENRLEPFAITRAGFAVLSAVHHEKKTRPAELAAFLGVDGAAITRHLDRAEKQGLIERKPSPADRRSTDINLTADGLRTVRSGHARSRSTNKKFTANLSNAEVEQLQYLLKKMLGNSDAAVADL
jgi:DNA-binding MarR family transcriptional regulator